MSFSTDAASISNVLLNKVSTPSHNLNNKSCVSNSCVRVVSILSSAADSDFNVIDSTSSVSFVSSSAIAKILVLFGPYAGTSTTHCPLYTQPCNQETLLSSIS